MKAFALVVPYILFATFYGEVHAQALKQLPKELRKVLTEMSNDCRQVGGTPQKSPNLLTITDLTGDEISDYVINQGAFECDGAASLFSGSGGSQMYVYVGTADGQAYRAFTSGVFDVKINQTLKPAKLQVIVGGALCGQRNTEKLSHIDLKSCWRPIVWNPTKMKMDFAPLSQIKFIH